MPSASNIKLETKPSPPPVEINHHPSSQPAAVVVTAPHQQHQPEPPIRQVLVLIEHKIRNLEKRKGKLDSYKDSQKSGKDLTSDQLIAVSKYDEVTHLLEFAREFVKQINSILAASEKEQKKIARREAAHRAQQDIGKVREVFIFQNILEQLKINEIRQDFVSGTNGAIKLEDHDFDLLDKLLVDITPIRGENDDAKKFAATAQKSAEIMFHVVDGRTKPYHGEITFEKVRALIQSIISSEYFDRQPEIVEEEKPVNGIESDANTNETGIESLSVEEYNGQEKFDGSEELVKDDGVKESLMNSVESASISEAPAPTSVPVPSFPSTIIPLEQAQTISTQAQVPIQQIVATPVAGVIPVPANQIPPHIGPTTVRAVEQAYFKQQYLQQIRPIAEVIGTGSFYFLQDSELDSPDPFPNVGFQPVSIINNIQHSPTGPQQQPQQQQQQSPPQPSPQQQQPVQVTQSQQPAPPNQIPNKTQPPQQQQLINASIQTQTFTNQNFKTIVPNQQQPAVVPYGQIKPSEINPAHIPGFATANNQIPVALSPAPQLLQNPQQNPVHIIAPAPAAVPIPGFVSPQQFVAPANISQQILNHPQQQSQPPQQPKDVQQPQIVGETKKIVEESPPPKIENWNPNDANPQKDTSNEWQEVSKGDRREDKDSSNTWNEQNQDNSGYSNRNMSRNIRGGGGGNMQSRQGGGGPRGPPSNNPNGNYHPRSQNAFQSGQSQNPGRPNNNNNNGTYFRNNDNYYPVPNGGGSNGNFLNSRQDNNGYNNGQYKPRPHMGGGGGGGGNMRGNGNPGAGGGQMRNNNTGGGNMIDRNNPQHVPRTNTQNPGGNLNSNRGGGNPGGPNMRPSQRGGSGNTGGPNGNYGGNTRPGPPPNTNQNSRTSQGINV